MSNIFTPEDKRYLRMVSNYLNSVNQKYGVIRIESGSCNIDDIDYDSIMYFSHDYRLEIPDGLKPILKKILEHIDINDEWWDHDHQCNYQEISFEINCVENRVDVEQICEYDDTRKPERRDFYYEHGESQIRRETGEILGKVSELSPGYSIVRLTYEGSAGNGEISMTFTNGISNSDAIRDFCFKTLEDKFDSWEYNEGSSGEFIFDLEDMMITLIHVENIEVTDSLTIFTESFDK